MIVIVLVLESFKMSAIYFFIYCKMTTATAPTYHGPPPTLIWYIISIPTALTFHGPNTDLYPHKRGFRIGKIIEILHKEYLNII